MCTSEQTFHKLNVSRNSLANNKLPAYYIRSTFILHKRLLVCVAACELHAHNYHKLLLYYMRWRMSNILCAETFIAKLRKVSEK